ncbi:MAG: LysR family transcriptional regulator [Erysipelotrichales bacterium]|nr:LysR family transcriptional regulator [Erysipelotrichales bacterium]
MNIRHLKIFVTVVETNSMNKAAKQLYIAQPTVSQAIKELEEYYGVALFERLNQKLFITESGKKLLPLARHVVEAFDTLDVIMKNVGEHPTITIGGSVSVGTALMPNIVNRFEEEVKDASIEVVIDNTSVLEKMLLNSEIDAAIVEGIIKNDDLILTPICKDELVVVVGKHHPHYNAHNISIKELHNQPAIMREDGSNNSNQFELALREHHVELDKRWSSTNTEAIKQAVIKGNKLGILSSMIIQEEVRRGDLRIVNVREIKATREINLVIHKEKYVGKALERFMQISKESVRGSY